MSKQYHLSSNGKWTVCPATIKCRLGGEHIGEDAYKKMLTGTGFTNVDDVLAAADAKTKSANQKEKFNKEKWLEEREAKLEKLQEELAKQVEDLENDDNWNAYLNSVSKFHKYSWSNQILIGIQKPDATQVAGFKSWKENFERQVKKGEKSITILAPVIVNRDKKDKDGKVQYGPDGKPLKDKAVIGFKGVPVFDVSQTEGKELPKHPTLTETPPEGFKEDLEAAITASGYTVSYEPLTGKDGYTSKDKRVVVNSKLTHAEQVNVLAHELGHVAAGHMEDVDKYHTGHGGARGRMEVEAESIAYALARSNGMSIKAGTGSSAYVAGWSKIEKGNDTVKEAAQVVSKTVGSLLSNFKWKNLAD